MIEDFLVKYHQNLEPESFEQKGKRSFLKPDEKLKLILEVNRLFKKKVPYKRRNFSKTTMIRTIIKEETTKLAQYLRENKIYDNAFRLQSGQMCVLMLRARYYRV